MTDPTRFHIVSAGRNLQSFARRNLTRMLAQNWPLWRCTWIDDASTDRTWKTAQRVAGGDQRIKLVRNTDSVGACANYARHIADSDPDEVIVMVDSDDELAHDGVLTKLATEYHDRTCWLTYGSMRCMPGGNTWTGPTDYPLVDLLAGRVRQHPFFASHLKTFRVALFNALSPEDLLDDDGRPWPAAGDLAFMLPMLEMAREHARKVHEVLYLYNAHNPRSNHHCNVGVQAAAGERVKARPPKQRLGFHPYLTR